MRRKTRIRVWIASIVIGVLLIPIGVGWIIYSVTQAGQYDANVEFTDPDTHVTSPDEYWRDSPRPFWGSRVLRRGNPDLGRLPRVTFGWFCGRDEHDDTYTASSAAYARSVPTTRVGWGPDARFVPDRSTLDTR